MLLRAHLIPWRRGQRLSVVAALLASPLVAPPRTGAQAAPLPPSGTALQRVVDSLATHGFTGQIVLGDRSRTLLDRSIGVPANATWRYASVSKQITAVLALREVDRGRLALDESVRRYLPQWPGPATITIRHLLQHTSGLPNPDEGPADADGVPRFYRRAVATWRQASAVADVCARGTAVEPGTQFAYNNCDYLTLQAVLEAVTQRPFPALVGEVVQAGGTATVPGRLENGAPEPRLTLLTYGAAGALTGTARSLLAFDQALLRGRILSDSARAMGWTGEPRFGYAGLGVWAFPATLRGCAAPVELIERRGEILGTQVRNILAPSLGRALIVFTNQAAVSFGEIWQAAGLSYELLSAALCASG